MKILANHGRNLASLEGDFEVPLDTGALASAGLYAITGPTGAGKSTLLDAMCLALFDETPRTRGKSKVKVGRAGTAAKDWDNVKDPRTVLRRGMAEGFAEVEFLDDLRRRWRARWEVRRARRRAAGKLQVAERSLHAQGWDGPTTAGKKGEVQAAIDAALGLTYDQFCRAVLLSQGQFAALLKAKAPERAELLEKLSGTGVYRKISRIAFERWKARREAIGTLEAVAQGAEVLAEPDRAALDVEAAAAVAHAAAAAKSAARWDELLQELGHRRRQAELLVLRRAERKARAEELAAAVAAAGAPASELEVKDVALAAVLAKVEGRLPRLEEARKKDADLAAASEAEARAGEALAQAEARRAEAEARATTRANQAETARRAKAEAEAWLGSRSRLAETTEGFPLLASRLERLAKLQVEAAARVTREQALEAFEAAEAAARQATAEEACAGEAAAQARQQLEAAEAVAADLAEPEEMAQLFAAATDLLGVTRRVREIDAEAVALTNRQRAAQHTQKRAAEALAAASAAIPGSEARLEATEAALERWRSRRDLGEHRRALVSGEPCPLCGAPEHPYALEDPGIEAGLAEEERLVTAARRELQVLRAQVVSEQQAGEQASQRAALEAADLAKLSATREALVGRWTAAAFPGAPEDPGTADAEAAAVSHRASLEAAQAKAAAARVAIASARKALDEAYSRRDKARATAQEAAKAEAVRRVDSGRADGERDAAEKLLRELAEGLRQQLPSEQAEEALKAPAKTLEKIAEEVAEYRRQVAARATAAETHEAAAAESKELQRSVEARRQEAVEAAAKVAAATLRLATAKTARAGLLQGRAVSQVEAEDTAAVARARAERDRAAAASQAAKVALTEARAHDLQAQKALAEAEEAVSKATDQAAQAYLGAVGEEAGNAAGEDPSPEEPARLPEVAEVREEVQRAAAARAAAEQAAGALQEKQRADDAARSKRAARSKEVAALRAEAEPWEKLSDLIGAADGLKFQRFAQGLTLDALVGEANVHLNDLARRYRLERVPGADLELQVVDRDLGDEVRSVESLSGGETFLVSLALALGLSGLASAQTSIESLFIDEGFGSLDPVSLDRALDALRNLEATGRQVGVISHVGGLADAVGVQVRVEGMAPGRSRVVVE